MRWWRHRGSNLGPRGYESRALTGLSYAAKYLLQKQGALAVRARIIDRDFFVVKH